MKNSKIDFHINEYALKKKEDLALIAIAESMIGYIIELMKRTQKHGRRYKVPGTKRTYIASAPGEPPAVRTGNLSSSIARSDVKKDMISKYIDIGTSAQTNIGGKRAKYGKYLEFGTSKIAKRPAFLRAFKDKKSKDRIIAELKKIYNI